MGLIVERAARLRDPGSSIGCSRRLFGLAHRLGRQDEDSCGLAVGVVLLLRCGDGYHHPEAIWRLLERKAKSRRKCFT
jgi:hypothetical protein